MVKKVNIKEANKQANIYVGRLRAVSLLSSVATHVRERRALERRSPETREGLSQAFNISFFDGFPTVATCHGYGSRKQIIEHLANYIQF